MNNIFVSWPPTMRNPSPDLKRCLGHEGMDNRTLQKRLEEYGFDSRDKQIKTELLLQRIDEKQSKKETIPNFKSYKSKKESTDDYLG